MAWGVPDLTGFLAELSRRRVLRVIGFYAISVWLILQISNIVFPALYIPAWVMTILVVAIIAGFPIVAVLAWVFDITPAGLVRTGPRDEPDHLITSQPRLWIDIAIISVLLLMVTYLVIKPGESDAPQRTASLAVLPFKDLSERKDIDHLSDGFTDALIATLARFPDLHVASASSSFAYKGQTPDSREVGVALNVSTVLEGSVRPLADRRLRVTAQLIDTASNFHLWSDTFDASVDDVFDIQDGIARAVAAAFGLRSVGDEQRLVEPMTASAEAYDLYLRGRSRIRESLSSENLNSAISYFNEALRRDPTFSLADVGLCDAYS